MRRTTRPRTISAVALALGTHSLWDTYSQSLVRLEQAAIGDCKAALDSLVGSLSKFARHCQQLA